MARHFNIAGSVKNMGSGVLRLFYPSLCEGCNKPLLTGEEILCIGCEMMLSRTDYHQLAGNETSLRLAGRVPFLQASSFAYFSDQSLIQHLVLGLKYGGKKATGRYLGSLFGRELHHAGWKADAIVPVPLHANKEAMRGYNQSTLIAAGLGKALNLPVIKHAVVRKKQTDTQTDKTRAERVLNVRDAFMVTDPQAISGRHLILVDDVLTTGATMESCAGAILAFTGVTISMATIGIAVN